MDALSMMREHAARVRLIEGQVQHAHLVGTRLPIMHPNNRNYLVRGYCCSGGLPKPPTQSLITATAGVLTKLDIMDRGTDALAMLHNEVLPLRLGYIAVINRSQQDIQQETPVKLARQNEARFFAAHRQYKAVQAQCGITPLSHRCAESCSAWRAAAQAGIDRHVSSQQLRLNAWPPGASDAAVHVLLWKANGQRSSGCVFATPFTSSRSTTRYPARVLASCRRAPTPNFTCRGSSGGSRVNPIVKQVTLCTAMLAKVCNAGMQDPGHSRQAHQAATA